MADIEHRPAVIWHQDEYMPLDFSEWTTYEGGYLSLVQVFTLPNSFRLDNIPENIWAAPTDEQIDMLRDDSVVVASRKFKPNGEKTVTLSLYSPTVSFTIYRSQEVDADILRAQDERIVAFGHYDQDLDLRWVVMSNSYLSPERRVFLFTFGTDIYLQVFRDEEEYNMPKPLYTLYGVEFDQEYEYKDVKFRVSTWQGNKYYLSIRTGGGSITEVSFPYSLNRNIINSMSNEDSVSWISKKNIEDFTVWQK